MPLGLASLTGARAPAEDEGTERFETRGDTDSAKAAAAASADRTWNQTVALLA